MQEIVLTILFIMFLIVFLVVWGGRLLFETDCISANAFSAFAIKNDYTGKTVSKEFHKIFFLALAIRMVVYFAGVLFSFWYKGGTVFSLAMLLKSWNSWDAPHYIEIAARGYQNCVENGRHLFLVFFPLYPWLLRLVHFVIRDWMAAGFILSTISFCIGSCYFYAFVKEEFGTKIAEKSYILLVTYPFSFFFGGIMTESLFFCLLSAGFYYVSRRQFFLAGVIGMFLSLCRIQGILLLGVGIVELFLANKPGWYFREKRMGECLKKIFSEGIWLLLIPVGNVIYFYINYIVEGDFFRFRYYQEKHWYHTVTFLPKCIKEIIGYAFCPTTENVLRAAVWLPELVIFFVAIVCLIYMVNKFPLKYSAFLFAYTLVNYSVTFLISAGRYMVCALPLFMVLAEISEKYRLFGRILIGIQCLFFSIYYAGYLMGWQVM